MGHWADVQCSRLEHFVCQKRLAFQRFLKSLDIFILCNNDISFINFIELKIIPWVLWDNPIGVDQIQQRDLFTLDRIWSPQNIQGMIPYYLILHNLKQFYDYILKKVIDEMYLAIQYRFIVLSRQNKTFIPFSPADFFSNSLGGTISSIIGWHLGRLF